MHDPTKNEIEETCQLRKIIQVSIMSVFLVTFRLVDLIFGMKKVCEYQSMFILHLGIVCMSCPPWSMFAVAVAMAVMVET